jgi:glycerol-3-phosphate dehydrogenase
MTEGKRILFAIPWGERTILGTTDTDYTGSLDRVTADTADIGYVLQVTNQFFPNAKLSDGDVISTWAGLRPLIANADGTPSDISRSHEIRNSEPGWWDVAGGKLTTYRLMAEQTVDQIVKALRREAEPCRTAEEPLLPQSEVTGVSGIQPPEFSRLHRGALRRQRMGRASGRCDGAPHELALLPSRCGAESGTRGGLDGRVAGLVGRHARGGNHPLL